MGKGTLEWAKLEYKMKKNVYLVRLGLPSTIMDAKRNQIMAGDMWQVVCLGGFQVEEESVRTVAQCIVGHKL